MRRVTAVLWLQVISQLRGAQPLPWEEGTLSPQDRVRVGEMYTPLMQLLARDPARRPSAAQFCDQCMAVSASATSVMLDTACGSNASDIGGASVLAGDSLAL